MNILILQGSPVENGNTDIPIRMLLEQLSDKHSFELIRMSEQHVDFCTGCNECQESGELMACVIKDDFTSIVEKMKSADLVIFASPLYVYSFPAQLKKFLDRMYCTMKDFKLSKSVSYLEGIKLMLLLTCIGPELVCDPCKQMFRLMAETQKGESMGEFVVPFCKSERGARRNSKYAVNDMVAAIEAMEL